MGTTSFRLIGLSALLACGLASISACASDGASSAGPREKTGRAMRVTYVNYPSRIEVELVNDSHSDRVETYSRTKSIAQSMTKIAPDEVVDELVQKIRANGFDERAAAGPAPTSEDGQALEIEDQGVVRHWRVTRTAAPDDRRRFGECAKLVMYVHENTFALQRVDRAPDFDAQRANSRKATQSPKKGS